MAEISLERLRERLLSAGVAPKHARRIVAELRDHHADLAAEPGVSAQTAWARLGDEETLYQAVVARPELRSFAHRFPLVAYVLAPTVSWLVVLAVAAVALVAPFAIHEGVTGTRWAPTGFARTVLRALADATAFGLGLAVAAFFAAFALRRRARPLWPIAGVCIVALVGGAARIVLGIPETPTGPGHLGLTFALAPPFPQIASSLVRAATIAGVVIGVYLVRRRRAQPLA